METMEVISNIDYLLYILVPGVVFLYVYDVLAIKKYSLQTYLIAGAAIGTILKTFIDFVNSVLLNYWQINFPIFLVYVLFAFVLAFAYFYAKNDTRVREFATNTIHIETADNFWTRYLDMEKGCFAKIYISNGNVIFGTVNSADDDYITLIDYCRAKSDSDKDIDFATKNVMTESLFYIKMHDILSIELSYEQDSKIKRFIFGTPAREQTQPTTPV